MKNIPMKFKDFEFNVNPQKIEINSISNLKQVDSPFIDAQIQNFSVKPNVISGEGSFVGNNASLQFTKLYELFKKGQPGELLFSGSKPLTALMTKLTKKLESYEDVLSYEFEFLEIPKKKENVDCLERYHKVKQGENLWSIACKYDVAIEYLMKINENISNPFNVNDGDKVKIR